MISQITSKEIIDYLRITEVDEDDEKFINKIIKIAREYIKDYTGLTVEKLDEYEKFDIVLYILCQDMFDTRTLYVDEKSSINKTVESILGMHCTNLL